MNFIKRILFSWISAERWGERLRRRLAAGTLLIVAAASLIYFQPRGARAQQASPPETGAPYGAAAIERLKRDGQYEALQTAVEQARFSVSRTAQTPLGRAAWHAPNRSAGYDAYVTEEGVSIALNDETYVGLHLHALGYGEALHAVGPGEVRGEKQTINLTRYSGLREWFINGPTALNTASRSTSRRQAPGKKACRCGWPCRSARAGAPWRARTACA
jgi:hypothetical protein